LCRRCTHRKLYHSKPLKVSPKKNHTFWVVTLLSQMSDMFQDYTWTFLHLRCLCDLYMNYLM
jgi:hypothetical protein